VRVDGSVSLRPTRFELPPTIACWDRFVAQLHLLHSALVWIESLRRRATAHERSGRELTAQARAILNGSTTEAVQIARGIAAHR
jgi:hypothetical protein